MQSRVLKNERPGWVEKPSLSEENPKQEQSLLRIPPSLGCFLRKPQVYSGGIVFRGISLLEGQTLSLAARRSTQGAGSSAGENSDFLRIFFGFSSDCDGFSAC